MTVHIFDDNSSVDEDVSEAADDDKFVWIRSSKSISGAWEWQNMGTQKIFSCCGWKHKVPCLPKADGCFKEVLLFVQLGTIQKAAVSSVHPCSNTKQCISMYNTHNNQWPQTSFVICDYCADQCQAILPVLPVIITVIILPLHQYCVV